MRPFQFASALALAVMLFVIGSAEAQYYQHPNCPGGVCQMPIMRTVVEQPIRQTFEVEVQQVDDRVDFQLELMPLIGDDESIDLTKMPITEASGDEDRLAIVTAATVRVTVGNGCGSGTIVGHDKDGNALILTNAHVAGTQRGKQSTVERWNVDGTSERSTAAIIASGYSRGLSVDFALLRASGGFGSKVTPVPLADRYPDGKHATNYGCPRCEWPSMQTIFFTDRESQILRWRPEAVGGRSGSSIVDYSGYGGSPVVVGLLTWGGGGEGLGQSSVFVLDALKGKMPRSFEMLPKGVTEVSCLQESDEDLAKLITEPEPGSEDDDAGFRDRRRKPDPDSGSNDRPIVDFLGRALQFVFRVALIVGLVYLAFRFWPTIKGMF